jgi:predicted RNA-binding protein YlqC (UPF0109 family)
MSNTEQLLMDIIKSIVTEPEQVQTHTSLQADEQNKEYILINIKVAEKDVGACIGTGGVTAEAVRKIIALAGFKEMGKKVFVKIDAPKLPRNHFFSEAQPS